jgi:hypothetical protein
MAVGLVLLVFRDARNVKNLNAEHIVLQGQVLRLAEEVTNLRIDLYLSNGGALTDTIWFHRDTLSLWNRDTLLIDTPQVDTPGDGSI